MNLERYFQLFKCYGGCIISPIDGINEIHMKTLSSVLIPFMLTKIEIYEKPIQS